MNVLCALKYDLDKQTLDTIYKTFIRPKLEYGCEIWDDCTNRDKTLLENFQLQAARAVTGAKRGPSHELLTEKLGGYSFLTEGHTGS